MSQNIMAHKLGVHYLQSGDNKVSAFEFWCLDWQAIAEALKVNSSITRLSVWKNNFGVEGAEASPQQNRCEVSHCGCSSIRDDHAL